MKPENSEYAPFYESYIKLTQNTTVVEQLSTQLESTLLLLKSLDEEQLEYKYEPEKWSIRELFQHIIDTEIVFAYRAFSIARGEKQNLPGFDQDEYVQSAVHQKNNLKELHETYRQTRLFTISLFNYLNQSDLQQLGTASGNPLSANAAGHIIIGHEIHHVQVLNSRYLNL